MIYAIKNNKIIAKGIDTEILEIRKNNPDCSIINTQLEKNIGDEYIVMPSPSIEDKKNKLRKEREILFQMYSLPLNSQKESEDRLISRGIMQESQRTITQQVVNFYDEKFLAWCALPDTLIFDNYTLEEINRNNTEIFGTLPDYQHLWDIS